HGDQVKTHRPQFLQSSLGEFAVVLRADPRSFPPFAMLLTFFLLLGRSGLFRSFRLFYSLRFLRWLEIFFQISNTQFAPIEIGVPIKYRLRMNTAVLAIRSLNRIQNQRAVFHTSANRSEFIHAPGKGHGARAWNKSKSRSQTGTAATCGRRGNGTQRFRADAERNAARGRGRCRARGRTARALPRIPRIASDPAKPVVAVR